MNPAIFGAILSSNLFGIVLTIIVAGLIYWIVDWGLTKIALPEPFSKIARVVLVLVVVIILVNAMLALIGRPLW